MNDSALPAFAITIVVMVIAMNLATAWVTALTMSENNGGLFAAGPPVLAALSCLSLCLCYYRILLPIDVSFWAAVFLAVMGFWGAWVDYSRLADRRKALQKAREARKSVS
jgi:hypothetical protein